jgi:hypothetical protein
VNGGTPGTHACSLERSRMAQPISSHRDVTAAAPLARKIGVIAAAGGAALGAALLLGAVVLWFRYGTAVFFEMIASGFAACF